MSKKITFLVAVLAVIILGILAWNFWGPEPALPPAEKTVITFAEGALTSPCFPITSAMVEVWNTYLPDIAATSELAPGRLVDNLKAIEEEKYNFRWAMSSLAFYSYNGIKVAALKEAGPMDSLRTIGTFWNHEVHVIAKADSPINDLSELKGKEIKVAVAAEKKWIAITAKEMLGIYGIPGDKIEIVLVPLDEIAESLKAGEADIGIFACSVECKQALILKKATGLKFLSLSQDIVQKLEEKYAYYVDSVIPGNTYQNQSEDVKGIAIKGTIVCGKDMDHDLVYTLTKTIFAHLDEVKGATPVAKDMSLEGAVEGIAIPLHPGAERYYSEVGLISK